MIVRPFPNIDGWAAFFHTADIPVLKHTVVELERLREKAEHVNARQFASLITKDPLFSLRVLLYIEAHRRKQQLTDITTIERAIIMIGVEPFFHDFRNLPLIETQLNECPEALLGLLKVIQRAKQASKWAHEWAVSRHDLDVDEITVATLLRYIAEMLIWCFAPTLALHARQMQRSDKSLRSSAIQTAAYNIKLDDLQLRLVKDWHLPELLSRLMDNEHVENARVRNVMLASNLARHAANGWDDAALPDDYVAIAELLHTDVSTIKQKLGLDAETQPLLDEK